MNQTQPSIEVVTPPEHTHHAGPPSHFGHHHGNPKIMLLLLILTLLSFCFAPFADNTFLQRNSLQVLSNQEMQIAEVTAVSATIATVFAIVPDDSTTPVADQIAGICSKLTYVLVIILFERLLLSFVGFLSFGFILPLSFISFFIHQRTGKHFAQKLAIRLLVLGVVSYSLLPISTAICTRVGQSLELERQIERIHNEADGINTASDEDQSLWESFTGTVTGAFRKIYNGIADSLNILKLIMNTVAAIILTDIFLPILVLFIYKWVLQKFLEVFFIS